MKRRDPKSPQRAAIKAIARLEQGTYGIANERFPFVPRPGHPEDINFVRDEMDRAIRGVDDMIYYILRDLQLGPVDGDTTDEIVQLVRIQLFQKALPKYDTNRKVVVKLSTYIYACIVNFVRQNLREIYRKSSQSKSSAVTYDSGLVANRAMSTSQDERIDRAVELIAEDIYQHPEKYMTEPQARVFREVQSNPDEMIKDLADRLDYRQASSLSMMMRRIRERVCRLSIEDGPLEEGESMPRGNHDDR